MSQPSPSRHFLTRARQQTRRKVRQLRRLSKKTLRMGLLISGAALVALVSLGFAKLADLALAWNTVWTSQHKWAALVVIPLAMMFIRAVMLRVAPYSIGSGIPQVTASLQLPPGEAQHRLVALRQTVWKIPLTFLGMIAGASIGREGPSVQVGAAVMLAWGSFWRRWGVPLHGVHYNELIAAGAAGGLAAAFNAPLAGVIFAIEELSKGTALRWQRMVLIGVLASGFIVVALAGNNPYFGHFGASALPSGMVGWVLICGLVNGVVGGVCGRLFGKGASVILPARWRGWVRDHSLWFAGLMGLALAVLGLISHGLVYGTGYGVAAQSLAGQPGVPGGFGVEKLLATLVSYWAGIPGGIFTPALTTGAGIGNEIWQLSGQGLDQRVLVLISMAAFLAAVTQAPLTACVVVMEMTGSQPMLFWLLVGAMLASVVARQFSPHAFYHFAAGRFRRQVLVEVGKQGTPARV